MNDLKKQGKIIWQSPSNIALIKYWGKYANQIPANPSISISLQNCYTQTEINYQYRNQPSGFSDLEFTFENKPEPKFAQRIVTYFESIESEMPFLKQYKLQINSYNTFPHSSGIASSASAMSALALGICTLESIYKNNAELLTESFFNRASYFARLASGSASRSVYGGFALWGKSDSHTESSDLFAMAVNNNISDTFKNMHNSILIVDSAKKELSSSNGHKLMETNPFAKARYQQANANLTKLLTALQSDNFNIFADIIENEALSLHSMMMTSIPWVTLIKPNTLEIINRIKQFRMQTGTKITFTLDAGPNVHVLYPETEKEKVSQFIKAELIGYCENQMIINDLQGNGPTRIYG